VTNSEFGIQKKDVPREELARAILAAFQNAKRHFLDEIVLKAGIFRSADAGLALEGAQQGDRCMAPFGALLQGEWSFEPRNFPMPIPTEIRFLQPIVRFYFNFLSFRMQPLTCSRFKE